jgi:alpha-tubulin suppressor-like RCC1 family protein
LQDSLVPVPISATWDPTRRAVAIAAGGYHSLALLDDGTVWTWGENSDGRLGWDTAGWPSAIPGQVVDARGNAINNVASIAGGEYHSIAVTTTRQVLAWGLNDDGQLGVNTSATPSSIIPVDVPRLTGVVAIAAGSSHSVASTSDGTVWTWGNNLFGQLGNGSTGSYEYTPAAVPGLINIMNIAAGSYHTIAVKSPGVDP